MEIPGRSRRGAPALKSRAILMVAFGAYAQQNPACVAKPEVPDNIAGTPAPAQPLPYSHKTHISRGLQCRQCYTNPDPGGAMTFSGEGQLHRPPQLGGPTCQTCHACQGNE